MVGLKNKGTNFCLLVLSLALLLGALELTSRIFSVSLSEVTFKGEPLGKHSLFQISADDVLLYELKNKQNSADFVDTRNIVVLGDSTSNITSLPKDYFYSAKLEKLFKGLGHDVRVINAAVPGYNTKQEVRYLEKYYLEFKPSLVVLGYCSPNDRSIKRKIIKYSDGVYASDVREDVVSFVENPAPWLIFLARNSALYRVLNTAVEKIALRFRLSFLRKRMHRVAVSEDTLLALKRLKQLAADNSFDVLVLVFPLLTDTAIDSESDWIVEQCKQLGFKYVDFRDVFFTHGLQKVKVSGEDVCHFNETGHDLVAQELFMLISNR